MLATATVCLFGLLGSVLVCPSSGVKQTLYMNNLDLCGKTLFNGDAAEGDEFIIKSNGWAGDVGTGEQSPMECLLVFNFQNRMSVVHINRWWCIEDYPDPSLEIYDNCDGMRKYPLVKLNCSLEEFRPLHTSGPCVTIIHSRQQTTTGYYFSLDIVISKELVIFPVSTMSAVVVSSIVVVMILIKVICLATGYENRLPKLNLTEEEEKKILEEAISHVRLESPCGLEGEDSCTLLVPGRGRSDTLARHSEVEGHNSRMSRDFPQRDYGYMERSVDDNSPPRLKRYPSFKATSLFRK